MTGRLTPQWAAIEALRELARSHPRGRGCERPDERRSLDTWEDWLLFGPRRH